MIKIAYAVAGILVQSFRVAIYIFNKKTILPFFIFILCFLISCSVQQKKEKLAVDNIIFCKYEMMLKDTGVVFNPEMIFRISKDNSLIIFMNDRLSNKYTGYYKGNPKDTSINVLNKILQSIKYINIQPSYYYDPTSVETRIWDGISYYISINQLGKIYHSNIICPDAAPSEIRKLLNNLEDIYMNYQLIPIKDDIILKQETLKIDSLDRKYSPYNESRKHFIKISPVTPPPIKYE